MAMAYLTLSRFLQKQLKQAVVGLFRLPLLGRTHRVVENLLRKRKEEVKDGTCCHPIGSLCIVFCTTA